MKRDDLFLAMNGIDDDIISNAEKHLYKGRMRHFNRRLSLAACAAIIILATTTITTIAAIHHFWGRGMNGLIQSTDEQKQILTDQGQATIYPEMENYSSYQITDSGVTITPDTVIVDDHYAYVSFKVSGMQIGESEEPGAEVAYYIGDDADDEASWLNGSSSFYDGLITDENGMAIYEDGSPIESTEDGKIIAHYADENGDLEYNLLLFLGDEKRTLLGNTLHVNFTELGKYVDKTEFESTVKGDWEFSLKLPTVSNAERIDVNKPVPGTVCTIESIDVTPISITVNYRVDGELVQIEDSNGIPIFTGVGLKDGSNYKHIANSGASYFTDQSRKYAVDTAGFQRIIEPSEVRSLFILTNDDGNGELVEIELP